MTRDITHHNCLVPGCPTAAHGKHVMCPSHWYHVPHFLRLRVLGLLDRKDTDPAARDRTMAVAASIASDLSARPRRVFHAATMLMEVQHSITLPSLCQDLAISKKRGAAILEMMINKGLIDDGDYLGIYHGKKSA